MNTIILPTTLTCAGCVQSIKPFFDSSKKIKEWKVDLSKPVKIITATGEELKQQDVIELLQKAGYGVLEQEEVKSTDLPTIGTVSTNQLINQSSITNFWSDTDKWKRASFNTLNCLIGCSIGDFGTIIFLQAYYPHTSMLTQMALATLSGLCTSVLLETIILKVREDFDWKNAFITAFSMSFISMITMEIAMNASDFMVTGGKAAFNSPQYWLAFVVALMAGFFVPLPYNYYKLKKYNKACH